MVSPLRFQQQQIQHCLSFLLFVSFQAAMILGQKMMLTDISLVLPL